MENHKGIRLNKAIADAGYCSRRNADELIFSGKVSINGKTETDPSIRVHGEDKIAINGKELIKSNQSIYVMLHKPIQTVCTVKDPQGRKTVLDCLPRDLLKHRLFPVGRLDFFSEGLLLLTNDGDFANKLMHPRHHQPKTYRVLVRGTPSAADVAIMRKGMVLSDGTPLLPIEIEVEKQSATESIMRMTLHQGINRQIRRMCQDLHLTILRLSRVAQGALVLGGLKPGQFRHLTADEIMALKAALD